MESAMTGPLSELVDTLKPAGDIVSIGVLLATVASWLPSVAAIFTIIWTAIRIYETQTVQGMFGRKGDGE